jgi:hypothetical protein
MRRDRGLPKYRHDRGHVGLHDCLEPTNPRIFLSAECISDGLLPTSERMEIFSELMTTKTLGKVLLYEHAIGGIVE